MKKPFLFIVLFSFFASTLLAQSVKDIHAAKEATWFGIDFSKAGMAGNFNEFKDVGGKSGAEIRDKYFPAWNDLIKNESEKYDIKKTYDKDKLTYDLTTVRQRNKAVDAEKLMVDDVSQSTLTKEDIVKIVSHYKSDKKGLGILYVVESFDKAAERATIWVTFFDISSRKVLSTEQYEGKPGGFGIRNFWAKSILHVIKESGEAYKKEE
jgi:hypothetical protein